MKTILFSENGAMEKGPLIRPLGPALYLWPPLVTTRSEMGKMLEHFRGSLITGMELHS